MKPRPKETILGIRFFTGSASEAVEAALGGELVLAPSGPGMADDLVDSEAYREALLNADINLTDSGFMLELWRWSTGHRLPRLSGLGFLRTLLDHPLAKQAGNTFWVMPSEGEQNIHLKWLNANGVAVAPEDCYIAPRYAPGVIDDQELVAQIARRKPRTIIVAIGGGVQERLGLTLKRRFADEPNRPGVVCIGAAIGFLSGAQVKIPPWVDRRKLGWLWRTLSSPRKYSSRYISALGLFNLLFRYKHRLPPLRVNSQASDILTAGLRPKN